MLQFEPSRAALAHVRSSTAELVSNRFITVEYMIPELFDLIFSRKKSMLGSYDHRRGNPSKEPQDFKLFCGIDTIESKFDHRDPNNLNERH